MILFMYSVSRVAKRCKMSNMCHPGMSLCNIHRLNIRLLHVPGKCECVGGGGLNVFLRWTKQRQHNAHATVLEAKEVWDNKSECMECGRWHGFYYFHTSHTSFMKQISRYQLTSASWFSHLAPFRFTPFRRRFGSVTTLLLVGRQDNKDFPFCACTFYTESEAE